MNVTRSLPPPAPAWFIALRGRGGRLLLTLALAACGPDGAATSDSPMTSEAGGPSTDPNGPTTDSGAETSAPTSGGSNISATDPMTSSTGASSSTADATSGTSSSTSGATENTSGVTTSGGVTTTGLESSTVTTDGSSSTGDCNFICPDTDGGALDCDPWAQDCPEGEKCVPTGEENGVYDATHCVAVSDAPKQPGDPCAVEGYVVSGVDDCDLGLMCWDVDPDTLTGVCYEMCTGTPDNPMCSNPQDVCLIANDGVLILCLDGCDPLAQNCPDGQGCLFVNDAFSCVPLAEEKPPGAVCEFVNVCAEGSACINGEAYPGCQGLGCCSPFCDLDLPVSCPEPQMDCVPWYEPGQAPPGLEDVGVCSLPG
ncbi:MAG: ribulose phosphate epimerase [Myxococcales bacterium]|nr:ribulose phosphate epimerase [Myxococcales bacterium]